MTMVRHRVVPWLVFALALLGIASFYSTLQVTRDTYRYLFVIDITQSMNVNDMKTDAAETTRLNFAKSAIESAFRNLPCGSEAGLGIFAAHRTFVLFTPVEICGHYNVLSEMLNKIDWRMAWVARSEVAKGIYSAIDAARESGNATRLVFLTDGHEAPPVHRDITPAFDVERGQIEGVIAGIGAMVPSRIPHLDDAGNVVGFWEHHEVMQIDIYSLGRATSEQGEPMVGVDLADVSRRMALGTEHLSSLREPYLQELATRTGLDYARIKAPQNLPENLRNAKYARRTPVLADLGWIPATLALVSLLYCFVVIPGRWSQLS